MISFLMKCQIVNVKIACLNSKLCKRLGVPIADEKTEVPVTSIEYLGLTIDTESMC